MAAGLCAAVCRHFLHVEPGQKAWVGWKAHVRAYMYANSSVSYMASRPISSDIGRLVDRLFRITDGVYDFFIEWVAIRYHWTLDSSCLYLACLTDSSNIQLYWTATHRIHVL